MAGTGTIMRGMDEIKKMLQKESEKMRKNGKQAMIDASEMLIADIKQSMIQTQKRSDGIVKTKSGKMHYPSMPYSPPALMDSNLIKSIRYIIYETKHQIIGDVGSYNVPYAAAMEWGYAPRGLEPRPWLLPAINRNQDKIFKKFGIAMSDTRYLK